MLASLIQQRGQGLSMAPVLNHMSWYHKPFGGQDRAQYDVARARLKQRAFCTLRLPFGFRGVASRIMCTCEKEGVLHGGADARLCLIRLRHHSPLVPCGCGRDFGAHLPMPTQVQSAQRGRAAISGLRPWTDPQKGINARSGGRKVHRMHGAPVGLTEPRRPRTPFGGLMGTLDVRSAPMSSSFTLNEIGAGIFTRLGRAASTARCVLQAAPIAYARPAMVPPLWRDRDARPRGERNFHKRGSFPASTERQP